jgi:hypothetical protein
MRIKEVSERYAISSDTLRYYGSQNDSKLRNTEIQTIKGIQKWT